jgi:hypothetical protein
MYDMHLQSIPTNTAQLGVENLAQTTFCISLISLSIYGRNLLL